MKTYIVILLTSLLFLSPSSQESPELKEAAELTDTVAKLLNERKADEALPLAKRALQIREKLLPPTDFKISISLSYLADVYIVKGDDGAAKQTLERLLKLLEERFGPDNVNLTPTLDRLAVLYNRDGNARKAEEMYQRGLAVREKAYGPESAKVAESTYALAQFYRHRGDFDRALTNYKRTLSIHGKLSGVNTPEFERASNGVYCLAYESKNFRVNEDLEAIRKQFAPPGSVPPQFILLNDRAKKLARPEYPDGARSLRLSGTVYVWVELDDQGNVISASDMCQGPPYLSESAVAAARKSTFWASKAMVNGVPVKNQGVIQYNFVNMSAR